MLQCRQANEGKVFKGALWLCQWVPRAAYNFLELNIETKRRVQSRCGIPSKNEYSDGTTGTLKGMSNLLQFSAYMASPPLPSDPVPEGTLLMYVVLNTANDHISLKYDLFTPVLGP